MSEFLEPVTGEALYDQATAEQSEIAGHDISRPYPDIDGAAQQIFQGEADMIKYYAQPHDTGEVE
jgi:hypothetical protein